MADKSTPSPKKKSVATKSISASSTLSEDGLQDIFNAMYDNPNDPTKILTPVDFQVKRKYMGVYLGIPLFADPQVGKDEVWVEYRNGMRERLPRTTVNDLAKIYPEDNTEPVKSAQPTSKNKIRR